MPLFVPFPFCMSSTIPSPLFLYPSLLTLEVIPLENQTKTSGRQAIHFPSKTFIALSAFFLLCALSSPFLPFPEGLDPGERSISFPATAEALGKKPSH